MLQKLHSTELTQYLQLIKHFQERLTCHLLSLQRYHLHTFIPLLFLTKHRGYSDKWVEQRVPAFLIRGAIYRLPKLYLHGINADSKSSAVLYIAQLASWKFTLPTSNNLLPKISHHIVKIIFVKLASFLNFP